MIGPTPHHRYWLDADIPRGAARFRHTRKSAITLAAAASTSTQSAAFETISIVPSIRTAWSALPATMTMASSVWAIRQVRGRIPSRRRNAASSATAKIAHIAITPNGENGGGVETSRAIIIEDGLAIQRAPPEF